MKVVVIALLLIFITLIFASVKSEHQSNVIIVNKPQSKQSTKVWLEGVKPLIKRFAHGTTIWTYNKITVQGWDVYISDQHNISSDYMLEILANVRVGLKHINDNVAEKRARQLKQFPIWIDNQPDYPDFWPDEKAQIPFHVSAEWLHENSMNPAMAWGVHIINPQEILSSSKHFSWQPLVLLHELTHGFNLKIMNENERKKVTAAFENAKTQKLYLNVERKWIGTGESKIQESAYAISNEGDYIAELTEAYFGYNETFPFNREQLKSYDPVGFKMIVESWLE